MNETPLPPPPTPTPQEVPTVALGLPADAPDLTATEPGLAAQSAPGYPAGPAPTTAYGPAPGASWPAGPPPQQQSQAPGGYPPPGYPPPGYPPSTYPPVGAYAPPQGQPRPRLTRSRTDRMVGGVCGGLARYWNTDPVLLRILTVVLTLATGGAFLIGYLLAWILIPDEPIGPQAPFGQYPGADQVGFAAGGNPTYADYGAPYEPQPPRERSYLGWLIVSGAVLAIGVIALLNVLAPPDITMWGVAGGIALAILGIGMLVGTWYGRARWVAFLAVPLAFLTFGFITAERWVQENPNWERWADGSSLSVGEVQWPVTPDALTGSPLTFEHSAGDAVLDLTGLTALGDAEPGRTRQRVSIDAGVGLGQLTVLIPADMALDLEASVDVGEIVVPGEDPRSGTDLDVATTVEQLTEGPPAYIVELDAAIGAGNLEVRREAA